MFYMNYLALYVYTDLYRFTGFLIVFCHVFVTVSNMLLYSFDWLSQQSGQICFHKLTGFQDTNALIVRDL